MPCLCYMVPFLCAEYMLFLLLSIVSLLCTGSFSQRKWDGYADGEQMESLQQEFIIITRKYMRPVYWIIYRSLYISPQCPCDKWGLWPSLSTCVWWLVYLWSDSIPWGFCVVPRLRELRLERVCVPWALVGELSQRVNFPLGLEDNRIQDINSLCPT